MSWNRPLSDGVRPQKKKPAIGKGFLAGFLVVAATGLTLWLVLGKSEPEAQERRQPKNGKIKSVNPVISSNRVVAVEEETPKPQKPKSLSVNGQTHPDFIPIGIQRMRKKVHKVRTNNVARLGPVPYNNATEQVLTHIFMRELGDPPPPETMLNLPERERKNLIGILISKNEITDKDSEEMAVAKETLEAAKKEMVSYLKDGGSADEFLKYYYDKLDSAYNERKQCNVMMMKTIKESPEIAAEFVEKINSRLREKGIKEITLPPQFITATEDVQ